MSRPGFVLEVDDRTPPLIVHEGEGFRLEDFPLGTRVIYPPESLPTVPDVEEAIREALLNPVDSEPLPSLLRPGMRLTIAFDDLSIPLPTMRKPDIRQRIIEQVLTMAADAGVDDVELIAANALHRRMTEAELKHIVGERVFRSFHPQGLLTNHDAEDHDNLLHVGLTDRVRTSRSTGGPPSPTCWSTSTSTWSRWTAGTSRCRSGWRRTSRCGTTTTRRRWSGRTRSWTTPSPTCTTRRGGWAGCSRTTCGSSRSRPRSTTTSSRRPTTS